MRTFVIGDPHGCADELRDLASQLGLVDGDRVIIAGDLVDRGPDPAGVIAFARTSGFEAVLGNHDEKMLRWFNREEQRLATGRENKMKPPRPDRLAQWESIPQEDRGWVAKLPLLINLKTETGEPWIVVHAGFEDVPMDEQRPDKIIRVRWLDADGKMVPLPRDRAGKTWSEMTPPGAVVWATRWKGPGNVVYGHAVHSLEKPRVDVRPHDQVQCWGIDTGCCFGGHLTALCLETRDFVCVQARREYSKLVMDDA